MSCNKVRLVLIIDEILRWIPSHYCCNESHLVDWSLNILFDPIGHHISNDLCFLSNSNFSLDQH